MGSRSGSLDPGVLLHLQMHHGFSAKELEEALNRQSGLLGLSGLSADMREILAAAADGHAGARLAVDVYAHRARQAIGALAATLGGVDALVFTAGVGENSPDVRSRICAGLGFLGLELDADANASRRADADVARPGGGRILVIETREDLTMLDDVLAALGAAG
jgi:acetate kinase